MGKGIITSGDDVDVDCSRCGQSRDLPDVGAPAKEFSPPTALARADHDLGDVAGASEVDERLGRIVASDLVPFGADIGGQLSQCYQLIVRRAVNFLAGHDMDDLEVGLDAVGHPRCPAHDGLRTRGRGDPHQDALMGFSNGSLLVLAEILKELVFGLVGEEAERQLPQRRQVVDAEVVGQGLWNPLCRVDIAVGHPAPELLWG